MARKAKTPLGEAGLSRTVFGVGGQMNYRRLENDHTARLFQAYFVIKHFGFVICGSIAASVSPFVATIRHSGSRSHPGPPGGHFSPETTAALPSTS